MTLERKETDPTDGTCYVKGCDKKATMAHGIEGYMVYTCDEHAGEVMHEIMEAMFGE